MFKTLARTCKRLTGLSIAAVMAAAGLTVVAAPAHALGAGEVCVFNEPDGASGFGHVGWGFLDPSIGLWTYGATENPNGSTSIPAGQFNGAWTQQGDFNQMLGEFTFQYDYPSTSLNSQSTQPYPAHPYTAYRCENTATSSVGAASKAGTDNSTAGYALFGNNCLDATIRVLNAYGVTNLPSAQLFPNPSGWFFALSSPWSSVVGLGETWVNNHSKLILDVPDATEGSFLDQQSFNNGDNQWFFRPYQSDGNTRIFNRLSGMCLGTDGGSTTAGARILQWACNGNPDQTWTFVNTGLTVSGNIPIYNIVNLKSGMCMGVLNASPAAGAEVIQWPCNGNADQEWY